MSIWSLLVSLALICCIGSVHSQSCFRDSDCDSGICCRRNRVNRTCGSRRARCPCQFDRDCKTGERCDLSRGVCETRNDPYFPTYKAYTFNIPNIPTIDPFDVPTFHPYPDDPYPDDCVLDSECSGSQICEDGQCRSKSGTSRGGLLSGSKLMGIVLFAIVATIISCFYYACKRTRKPPNLPSRNVNINAPPTGVEASRRNDREMQAGNVGTTNLRASDHSESTNSTAVVVEDETPLPPGAPPPYSSLKFEARQGSESLSDQSPPSYDEAVRNLTSA